MSMESTEAHGGGAHGGGAHGPSTATTTTTSTATSPLASILWFASSNFFRQIVNAGATLLRPVLLSPEHFGLFTALRLIPTYAHHLHLGARDAMRYLVPHHEIHGEHEEARRLKATVLTGTTAVSVLAGLIVLGLAAFSDWSAPLRIGLAICGVTVLLIGVHDHFFTELKAHQFFKEVGVHNYVNAFAMLTASLVLILWLGFYGALMAQAVVLVLMLVYMGARGQIRTRPRFEPALFRKAVALGGPTLAFDVCLLMTRNVDRLIIANWLDMEQLGYYALGAMMIGYLMHIPGATREVMEAKIFETRRGMPTARAFETWVLRPMAMIAISMTALIGPVVLALPVVLPAVLPEYAPGVLPTQILMIGGYFMAIAFPIRGILAAHGWQWWGAAIFVASVALHVGVSALLIHEGLGIVGVALSTGITQFVAAAGLFVFVLARLPERPRGLGAAVAGMLGPLLAMLGLLYGAARLADWLALDVGLGPWVILAVQLALYGAAVALGLFVGARTGWVPVPPGLARRLSPRARRAAGG